MIFNQTLKPNAPILALDTCYDMWKVTVGGWVVRTRTRLRNQNSNEGKKLDLGSGREKQIRGDIFWPLRPNLMISCPYIPRICKCLKVLQIVTCCKRTSWFAYICKDKRLKKLIFFKIPTSNLSSLWHLSSIQDFPTFIQGNVLSCNISPICQCIPKMLKLIIWPFFQIIFCAS